MNSLIIITANITKRNSQVYTHTHTHTPLTHFAVPLKLTQHCKSAIFQLKKKKQSDTRCLLIKVCNFTYEVFLAKKFKLNLITFLDLTTNLQEIYRTEEHILKNTTGLLWWPSG